MYDIYRYFAPITFSIDYYIHQGEFPLWNPLTYCGMPYSGNPQSFLFYLPNLIRSLLTINPTPASSNISLAIMWGIHFVFMALCTYLLARSHKLSVSGSLAAAIAFAFSALMVRRMCEYHYITSIAWLPLLMLLLKKMIDAKDFPSKIGLAILSGLTLGMGIMGGFLQIIYLLGFLPALYALFYFLLNTDWENTKGSLLKKLRPWAFNGAAMATVFILGASIAALTLLPAWELGEHGLRSGTISLGKFSDLWKWTPLDFYQKMVLYTGIKYESETIRNSGVIALLLACAGLTHRRRRDVFMFVALYLILFECSFGPPLPIGALLEKITPFSLSAYSRAYDFGLLPLSLLVGYGVDAISQPLPNKGHSYARALILALLAFVFLSPMITWNESVKGWLEIIDAKKYVTVNNSVTTIPIIGLILMLALGTLRYPKTIRLVLTFILPILIFSETFAWNSSFVPYMTHRKISDRVKVKQDGHELSLANFRGTDPICNRFQYSMRFAMNGVDPMHLNNVRNILSGPPREGPGLRGVQNWEPTRANLRGNMIFKRSFWLAQQYAVGKLPKKQEYFPSATTVFLEDRIEAPIPMVDRQDLPNSSISSEEQVVEISSPATLFNKISTKRKLVLKFSAVLPKTVQGIPAGSAGAVHSALVYSYKSSTNAQIDITFTQPGTDRSEMGMRHIVRPTSNREAEFEIPLPDYPNLVATIHIENKGRGSFQFTRFYIKSDPHDEDGLIEILARTANTVDLQIGPLKKYRILTFLDAFYPGWYAFVDGDRVPILRTNEQFKGIVLPPGTHRVYFVFRPPLVIHAGTISFTALAMAIVGLALCWYFKRRNTNGYKDNFPPTEKCDGIQESSPPVPE
ncbi:MAG: hypothetical protein KAH38_11055 [Candidatus Hydrogenedentes bacterium]|nr:hypothetical protein [Candidatus Hydrogenedentota bacterium]